MDMVTVKFRDIALKITSDSSLSSDDLLFLFDYVLEYLDEHNIHPSYEYISVACDYLFCLASRDFIREHRESDKMEGGE